MLLALAPIVDRTEAATSVPSTAAPAPVSVSITDNQATARSGDKLTYQTTVTNMSAKDVQLLLEIAALCARRSSTTGSPRSRGAG